MYMHICICTTTKNVHVHVHKDRNSKIVPGHACTCTYTVYILCSTKNINTDSYEYLGKLYTYMLDQHIVDQTATECCFEQTNTT